MAACVRVDFERWPYYSENSKKVPPRVKDRRRRSHNWPTAALRKIFRERLVALQNADCTTVRGEFDFGEAAAHGTKEPLSEFGGHVADAMRIRLEISFGLIVNGAGSGLGFEVKGIVPGKVHFDGAFATFHRINAGADEIAVVKNIAGHGKQGDTGQTRLQHLGIAADGIKIQFSRALRAHQRYDGGAYDDIAGDFLEGNFACDALQGHVAHDLFDV